MSITRRWLRENLLIVLVVLAIAEGVFVYMSIQNYYGEVRQSMEMRFSGITGQLAVYTAGQGRTAEQQRIAALLRMVEQFDAKDRYEMMLLDESGRVLASSSGTPASGLLTGTDLQEAKGSNAGQGSAVYRSGSGEWVLSCCVLLPMACGEISALRLVTSLTLVNRTLEQIAVIGAGVMLLALFLYVFSGMYFIRSIVVPLTHVEDTANRIAGGDLDARLTVKPGSPDEIGKLSDTINQMAASLSETERLKNNFISSVSHELRTPLTSIKGWVETIAGFEDPNDENYRKGLEIIGAETDRLYTMVEELLDYSRLQSGVTLQNQVLDLGAEVTDAVLFFAGRARREQIAMNFDEPEEMLIVNADPDKLRQVFINVLDNALKYSAPGGSVTLTLQAEGDSAVLRVRDQGRGIPPEDLDRIKEKFFKASNAVYGSGIGLALVDEIMRASGGSAALESTLGVGTTVILKLPLHRAGEKEQA